jgi:hypothetical protein
VNVGKSLSLIIAFPFQLLDEDSINERKNERLIFIVKDCSLKRLPIKKYCAYRDEMLRYKAKGH